MNLLLTRGIWVPNNNLANAGYETASLADI